MSNSTQVSNANSGTKSIRDLISSPQYKNQFAAVLPKHLSPDRFVRVVLTAITRTPQLAECDQASFFQACLSLSQFGLEPDGRNAHLIPFRNARRGCIECQLIIDYKGLVELAYRSGRVSFIHADAVCENDQFVYSRGELKAHDINWKEDRGEPYAYYAFCRMKDGSELCLVMSKKDVDKIRRRSKSGDNGPWKTDYDEMAKKTVFRRLSKWLSLSSEFRDAVATNDESEGHTYDVSAAPVAQAILPPDNDLPPETDTDGHVIEDREPLSPKDEFMYRIAQDGFDRGALLEHINKEYADGALETLDDINAGLATSLLKSYVHIQAELRSAK